MGCSSCAERAKKLKALAAQRKVDQAKKEAAVQRLANKNQATRR